MLVFLNSKLSRKLLKWFNAKIVSIQPWIIFESFPLPATLLMKNVTFMDEIIKRAKPAIGPQDF
jgi:hypothetical protein